MKKTWLLLAVLLVLLIFSRPAAAQGGIKVDDSDDRRIPESYIKATGGPDPFGYTYTDSDDGCPYEWIEIESTGTDLNLDGDDVGTTFSLGFSFPFYDNTYTTIGVSSNGYLTFGSDLIDYTEDAIPNPTDPNDLIAPFWDDQEVQQANGDAVYYQLFGSPGDQYLVIEFVIRDRAGTAPYRYEAILYENGDIRFQYNEMTTDADGTGISAAVGIENEAGQIGLGYLYHLNPPENEIHNGLAVCIHYPDNLYLSPGWQAGYGHQGETISYTLTALNQSGLEQQVAVSVEGSVWTTTVTPTLATIPHGLTIPLTVAVTVPPGSLGLTDTATIRVASLSDPVTYSDTARVETGSISGLYGYVGTSTTDEAAIFDQELWVLLERRDLLPEGNYPYGATMTLDGREVWIAGASGDGVVVIETATNQIVQRIGVGQYPVGIAFRKDGAYGFVANRDTEDVTVIDAHTYQAVDTIPIPTYYLGAGKLALNPVGGEIYVVDWYGSHFFVLDPDSFAVVQEVALGSSLWQPLVNPQGDTLYITDRGQDVVHVLDTATLSLITSIPVGDDPWGIDITPDGSLLYVTNEDSHDVTVIDAATNSVVTTISLPHTDADPRDVDISRDGAYAYVTSGDVSGHDWVYVIETTTQQVVGQVDLSPAANPNVIAVAPQMGSGGLQGTKTAAPDPVVLGDPLTYTIGYLYTGLTETQAYVTDTLPSGIDYLTSTGGTYDPLHHQVIWDLGMVTPGVGELLVWVLPADPSLIGQPPANGALLSFGSLSATVQVTSTVVTPLLSIRLPGGSEPPDPLPGCAGSPITLTAHSNRAGPLALEWAWGDGSFGGGETVTHTYASPGAYTVWLTSTNRYGWVETDTLRIEVGQAPLAGFVSNSPVELGRPALFTDTTVFTPTAWQWDFGDGVGRSSLQNPVYTYTSVGLYTVTLTVTNGCGVDVTTGSVVVEEVAVPRRLYLPLVIRD